MASEHKAPSELLQRTRWYIRLRWFILAGIVLPTVVSLYFGNGLTSERITSIIIGTVVLGSNLVFYVLNKLHYGPAYDKIVALGLLTFDTLYVTFFIYCKGGIESRSLVLYALPIMLASVLFGRAGVYTTAIGSAVGYDFVILANYFGWLHSPEQITGQWHNISYMLNSVVFFTLVLVVVGMLADFITRLLIQNEQQARSTAQILKRAQQIAHLGSWEWDVVSNRVTWSDELYRIYGLAAGEPVTYQTFLGRLHPDDRDATDATITRSFKTHLPFSFDSRVVRPDKTAAVVHGEGKVMLDKHGKVVQLYGITQDVTAERALEAAKGDFVSLASHQLRTPASGVRMLLAMLRDGYVGMLTPQQMQTVVEAYEANERMLRIADDLLNVAKLESGRLVLNRQQVELCIWLKNVIGPHKLLAKQHRQKLQLVVPKGTAYLKADPERLAMVLDNLLSNARKYTPSRGSIRIALRPGKKVHRIVVTDTGVGMSRSEIGRLFGKFTRLNNQASKGTEGTGLGLYLAKSIIDLHQGRIRVSSKPGIGSTFTITLPTA